MSAQRTCLRELRRSTSPATSGLCAPAIAQANADVKLAVPRWRGAQRSAARSVAHVDLDLVVEGDALELATRASQASWPDPKVVLHGPIRNRRPVAVPASGSISRPRARERYAAPGRLTRREPGHDWQDDLARRDFSINAIALRLTPRAGEVIDPSRAALATLKPAVDPRASRAQLPGRCNAHLSSCALRRTVQLHASIAGREPGYDVICSTFSTISGARLRREIELIAAEDRVAAHRRGC